MIRASLKEIQLTGTSETRLPNVTIVVLTRQRAESLRRTLAALTQLDYPHYEVVVVDNLSTDHTCEVAKSFDVRYLYCPAPGVSICRQVGIDASQSSIVAMCDDDCVPVSDWMTRMVQRHLAEPDLALLGGQIINVGFGKNAKYKGRGTLVRNSVIQFVEDPNQAYYYGSANITFKRAAVQEVGGYDPFFRTGGYEEADLITRLKAHGYRVGYEVQATVEHHHVETNFRHNRMFYTGTLLRLYFHLKHFRPRTLSEWGSFWAYEMLLMCRELNGVPYRAFDAGRKRNLHHWNTLARYVFNSVSARLAIPWLVWKVNQRRRLESTLGNRRQVYSRTR